MQRELVICLWFNRACHYHWIQQFFSFISWLGDGKFWYSLAFIVLPLYAGMDSFYTILHMTCSGLTGVLIYKLIKSKTERQRPYYVDHQIKLGTAPLDHYSFPSGHTLHAVNFSIILLAYYPEFGIFLIPFASLVALSRVILGLHFPTDVIMGAFIGMTLAISSFQLF